MKVGFIGLGNVGSKLSNSLLRNGFEMVVRDLDRAAAQPLLDGGPGGRIRTGNSPKLAIWSSPACPLQPRFGR